MLLCLSLVVEEGDLGALSGLPPVIVSCWVGATPSSTQVGIAAVFVSALASPGLLNSLHI